MCSSLKCACTNLHDKTAFRDEFTLTVVAQQTMPYGEAKSKPTTICVSFVPLIIVVDQSCLNPNRMET